MTLLPPWPAAIGSRYSCLARTRAETEKIRTKPLMFLDSSPEMQQIAAKPPHQAKFPQNREFSAL
jgi:hypothetical protein